jgi:hypothetical protein
MQRSIEVTLGDASLTLVADWRASLDIAERVGDPMMIAREAVKEAVFIEKGLPFRPDFALTIENVAQIIYIGAKSGGSALTLDAVGGLMFDAGLFAAKDIATSYLALIIGPKSEELSDNRASEDKAPGKK